MKQYYNFDIELWKLFVRLLLYDLVLRIAIHVPGITWLSSIRSFSFLIQVKEVYSLIIILSIWIEKVAQHVVST